MEKLKKLCEAALSSGVRVTRENLFDLARLAGEFSCLQPAAGNLLTKCSKFLRQELPKDFGILCDFDREDFETFQVLSQLQNLSDIL